MYSKNNNNIITHLSNGKPVARDKNKDFIANYRPEEEFLCWKADGGYGVIIYSILKHRMGMDKFQYGSEKEYYTIPNNVVRRYMSRQRKNEAIEDLEAAGLLEILEAAPGKNKKVRLNFKND